MDRHTIETLNQLNQQFYQQVNQDFHRTRQHSWPGWSRLEPNLKQLFSEHQNQHVVDYGCGNGRFGVFLAKSFPDLQESTHYWGCDQNQPLLDLAAGRLAQTKLKYQLVKLDLVSALLDEGSEKLVQIPRNQLSVMFGLLHHIPCFELRRSLIHAAVDRVLAGGMLITTYWKFLDVPRLQRRLQSPKKVNLDHLDLEDNDYFLDWQRGETSIRYCHYVSDTEAEALFENLPIKLVHEFRADGSTNQANHYQIWQKV